MEKRHHIQHYRNGSGTTEPNAENLLKGELAIGYFAENEKIYAKNSLDKIVKWSADGVMEAKLNEQDARLSATVGLSALTEDDKTYFQYAPTSDLLKGFTNMNESVDYLAGQLKSCLELIEELKSNVYMINTNFTVVPDSTITSETVSYSITNNDNPTTPESVIIKKSTNGGTAYSILESEGESSGSVVSNIDGATERFIINVQPDLEGAMETKVELTRYLCYAGATSSSALTSSDLESFTKYISDGDKFEANVSTQDEQYIWLCVPNGLNIFSVTNEEIPVTLYSETTTIATSYGTYKCYRSYQMLLEYDWDLIIKHKA